MKTLIRVWFYGKRYKRYALGTMGCAIITTLAATFFPKAAEWVIDEVIVPQRIDLLLPYVLWVAGAFFLRDVFNSLRIRFNNLFEQRVVFDLRCDLYDVLQRLPLHWYDEHTTGDIVTRVEGDVSDMERVFIDGIEQGVVAVLQIGIVGVYLFVMNVKLALWVLFPIPFLLAGTFWYTKTAHRRFSLTRQAVSSMNSLLVDNVQGVRQIKSYAREDQEKARFAQRANGVRQASLKVMNVWATYHPSMTFIASLGLVIVLYFGGLEVIDGASLTRGEFVSFLLFVGMFYEPIGKLHSLNQMIQAGRAAGDRVFEILDTAQEKVFWGSQKGMLPEVKGEVVYKKVGFAYRPGRPILQEISFEAAAGQTIALVGHSGAGKSTLCHLLSRFYEATEGKILIDGVDIHRIPLKELREKIGWVSQESFLFQGTVWENLVFGRPEATLQEVEAAAQAAYVHHLIESLPQGYQTQVGERGVKLSIGEKQRLSIARALLKDPPLLVLDEATASVDTATEKLIQKALDRLLKGRTSFIIAHRLSTIQHADHIFVLREGRLAERGTHEELLEREGLYAKLCRVQGLDWINDEDFERLEGKVRSAS